MTALRRVSLAALCASSCLLVACDSGIVEVKTPAAETVAPQDLTLAFTATRHWRLVKVMLGSEDITSRFQPQDGDAGVVSSARIFLPFEVFPATGVVTPTGPVPPSIRQTLEITADLGQAGDSQGIHHAIKTQEIVIEKEVLTVGGVVDHPTYDPTKFRSPAKVSVTANFPWRGLHVIQNDDTTPLGDMTVSFHPGAGGAGLDHGALSDELTLAAGDWKYTATVLDATNHTVTGSGTIHVVKDVAPDCPSPAFCTGLYTTNIPGITVARVGATLNDHCGKGHWAYTDPTRAKCRAEGGDYSAFDPTPADNNTLCPAALSRKYVNGTVTCIDPAAP